jgi:hypothetical protein
MALPVLPGVLAEVAAAAVAPATKSHLMRTKAGIGLIVLGIGVFVGWKLWMNTRSQVPVNVPVSLKVGETIEKQFRLNLDGLYLVEIVAAQEDAEKDGRRGALRCWMGVGGAQCAGVAPVIGANWALFRDGQEVRRGNSLEPHSEPTEPGKVVRVIGEFPGEAGHEYRLEVSVTTDGSALQAADPRLRVAVSSIIQADFQSANILAFSVSFICLFFGAILLGIGWFAPKPAQRSDANHKGV